MAEFIAVFVSIFVALDIIGTLPIYISISRDLSKNEKAKVVNTSIIVAIIVALFFITFGTQLFRFLGIETLDFKIAGGIILLLVSLSDLLGGPEVQKKTSGSTGIVPLAVPLITGPGVITTSILQVSQSGYWFTFIALIINLFIAWWVLKKASLVTSLIGKDGTVVVSKISALLLAAIAVAMIRSGVMDIFLMTR